MIIVVSVAITLLGLYMMLSVLQAIMDSLGYNQSKKILALSVFVFGLFTFRLGFFLVSHEIV